jgi:5'-nucleotidase
MPVQNNSVININIPPLSTGKPKGIRVVPQSYENFDEYFVSQTNEQGQTLYQLAGGEHRDEQTPTDTISLVEGYITITALAPGRTDYEVTEKLKKIKF